MKKRIRKKRHLGEFTHFGIELKLSVQESNAEEVYDKVIDIAERNGLVVWGGGLGRFSMPQVYGNYRLPALIEKLTMFVALQGGIENEMMFCAYSLTERTPSPDFEKEMRSILRFHIQRDNQKQSESLEIKI